MFGSQALEVAIGASFFMAALAMTASGLVESVSRLMRRRANILIGTLNRLLDKPQPSDNKLRSRFMTWLKSGKKWSILKQSRDLQQTTSDNAFWTSDAYLAALAGVPATRTADERKPSYLDPETFVDGIKQANVWIGIEEKKIRQRFDEATKQASAAYKCWATFVLFLVAFALCAGANLSIVAVAQSLWHEDDTRAEIIADIARGEKPEPIKVTHQENGCPDAKKSEVLPDAVAVGWDCWPWQQVEGDWKEWIETVLAWLLTALLTLLGAQFWFDTMGRLVNLRPGGAPKAPAS